METSEKKFRDRKIFITSDIEGGNAYNFKKYPGDVYSFSPRRDPGENYSSQGYYFKLQLENLRKDVVNITLTAIAQYDDTWKGWQVSLDPVIWIFHPNNLKEPERLSQDKVRATPQSMSINLTLQPYEKIILTNMFTPSYSDLIQELHELGNIYPTFLKLEEIGQSPMGNQMYAIQVNPNQNKEKLFKILVGGTSQSNEFGDFGALCILQRFLEQGADFWDDFSKKFCLEFLFFQNPDGMVMGTNMVNARQENPFFSYFTGGKSELKENQVIWEFIKVSPPKLYLEMHSFFQDHKLIQPYLYPHELLSSRSDQKLYEKIAKSLIKYSNGNKEEIHLKQPFFENTLCYRLMENFQTLCFQYKLHSGMSVKLKRITAWDIFWRIYKILKKK